MNTQPARQPDKRSDRPVETKTDVQLSYSELAYRAIQHASKRRMYFKVLGYGPVPETPFVREGWRFEILKSQSITDSRILERMKVLEEVVTPTMYLIAHEPEVEAPPKPKEWKVTTDIKKYLGIALVAFGIISGFFLLVGIGLVVAIVTVPFLLLDPVVVAILPDGTWLEIAWYYG